MHDSLIVPFQEIRNLFSDSEERQQLLLIVPSMVLRAVCLLVFRVVEKWFKPFPFTPHTFTIDPDSHPRPYIKYQRLNKNPYHTSVVMAFTARDLNPDQNLSYYFSGNFFLTEKQVSY